MGTDRYALMFKPGTYGTPQEPLIVQVGYNTEVLGLGLNPTDVTINGHVDVYNRCRPATGCFALDSFWRSLSNLTINVTGGEGCRASANFWAASQAAPMRRVNITGGKLSLMDYCTDGPQYASGGFIADSKTGDVVNGSQQQYIVRNSSIGAWSNGVWNQVFSGVIGAPDECFPAIAGVCGPYTTLSKTPREPREALPLHRFRWQVQRLRPGSPDRLLRSLVGERSDTGPRDPAVEVLRGQAL